MHITVEISLYPLNEDYSGPIKDFIVRLKRYKDLDIVVNATSTLIEGEHARVFEVLSKETAKTFESGRNIFVIKVIGFDRDIHKEYN